MRRQDPCLYHVLLIAASQITTNTEACGNSVLSTLIFSVNLKLLQNCILILKHTSLKTHHAKTTTFQWLNFHSHFHENIFMYAVSLCSARACPFLRVSIQKVNPLEAWTLFPLHPEQHWDSPQAHREPQASYVCFIPFILTVSGRSWDVWLAACCTWLCGEGSGDGVHLGFSLWAPGLAVSADFSWRESEWRPRGAKGRWVLAFCQD